MKVRVKGLEPPRITPPDPKSGAAANYAIPALDCKGTLFPLIINSRCTCGVIFAAGY